MQFVEGACDMNKKFYTEAMKSRQQRAWEMWTQGRILHRVEEFGCDNVDLIPLHVKVPNDGLFLWVSLF
jgi:hypothetical protein